MIQLVGLFGLALPVDIQSRSGLSQIPLGIAVAFQAPGHEERLALCGQVHLFNRAVAIIAIDPAIYVDAMVEIYKFRKLIYSVPLERNTLPVAIPQGLQQRAVCPDLRMARHAGMR